MHDGLTTKCTVQKLHSFDFVTFLNSSYSVSPTTVENWSFDLHLIHSNHKNKVWAISAWAAVLPFGEIAAAFGDGVRGGGIRDRTGKQSLFRNRSNKMLKTK